MSKIFVVAGLGFGDEGKGTITEYLTAREKAHLVVRYNGGAQAAHNVTREDRTHHTFSQFGSGAFEGASTHLSRYMIIDLPALLSEATALASKGVHKVFDKLTIEDKALLVTPYQKAANRLRELARSPRRHGSCGMGIGETVSDHLTDHTLSPKAEDLRHRGILETKLAILREQKFKEFSAMDFGSSHPNNLAKVAIGLLTTPVKAVVDNWMTIGDQLNIVGRDHLFNVLEGTGSVVFEGAQGVLLDQTWGFHPHTTWSDITYNNAEKLIGREKFQEATKIGVLRTYMTRHGEGPFPSSIRDAELHHVLMCRDSYNVRHDWQGYFRVGHFDTVLLRYALKAMGQEVDQLALTHMDALPKLSKLCVSYSEHGGDIANHLQEGEIKLPKVTPPTLEHQSRLTHALGHPGLDLNYWPVNDDFVTVVENIAKIKVGILSNGPMLKNKVTL